MNLQKHPQAPLVSQNSDDEVEAELIELKNQHIQMLEHPSELH